MTEPLSPAAQAVRHVAICAGPELEGRIAAALRAAADQVVPETESPRSELEYDLGDWDARDDVRDALLAIAAELKALPE